MFCHPKNGRDISLILVCALYFLASTLNVHAIEPMPSKDQIPQDISGAMKRDIEKLYSSDAIERAKAAQKLGREKAISAAPFLIGMLDDNTRLHTNDIRVITTPGREAAMSLVMMGKIDVVISALTDKDSDVRVQARMGLEYSRKPAIEPLILALKDNNAETRKIVADILFNMTIQLYGEDYEKWTKWWNRNKDNYR